MKARFVFLFAILTAGCSLQGPGNHPEFPLYQGTTWVYTYQAYEPSGAGLDSVLTASYELTETVVDTETVAPYFVAHVKREQKLVDAEPGWTGATVSNQSGEIWYVVSGRRVFSSGEPLDRNNIKLDGLTLAYDFPLTVNKRWCPLQSDPTGPANGPLTDCQFSGEREVSMQGAYESAAGAFDDCYDMIDHFNGGNIFQKFCVGVGVVSMKFDHMGTRFGFEKTLTRYSVGIP